MSFPTVAEIVAKDRAALIAAWSDLFGTPVPKGLSQPFLRRFLAFEVQARVRGGLPRGFARDLTHRATGRAAQTAQAPRPGGRLLREWNGITHTVEVREAARLGLRSKRRAHASRRRLGGGPLSRGQIHKVLVNPIHVERIRHKDRTWPGRHPAILDEALWSRVQERLQADARRPRGSRSDGEATAPLARRLRDETGDRLTPTHASRRGRRFRYYVSNRLIAGGEALAAAGRDLATSLREGAPETLRRLLRAGTLRPHHLDLTLDAMELAKALDLDQSDLAPDLATVAAPLRLRRRGVEARLVVGNPVPRPDPVLLRALAEAHRWAAALKAGTPLAELARAAGRTEVRIRVLARLAFLSPAIQRAILEGTQPPDLTLKRLVRGKIPLGWDAQVALHG